MCLATKETVTAYLTNELGVMPQQAQGLCELYKDIVYKGTLSCLSPAFVADLVVQEECKRLHREELPDRYFINNYMEEEDEWNDPSGNE